MILYDIYLMQLGFHPRQWSVDFDKNREEAAIYKRRHNTQSNTKAQNTQSRKRINKTRKKNLKIASET